MIEQTIPFNQAQLFEYLFPSYTGSMTALIESSFEGIVLKSLILAQSNEPVEGFLADMAVVHGFPFGATLLYRRALLIDAPSEKPYLYASTLINVSAFPATVVQQIQHHPSEPLGRILKDLPLEKTILSLWHRRDDPFLLHHFSETGTRLYHGRRVLFTFQKQAGMLLEEIIPCRCPRSCPILPTPFTTHPPFETIGTRKESRR